MSARPLPRAASITLAAISCLAAGIVPAQAAVDRGAGDAESGKVRRRLGGQAHFLGRLRARLGGHAHVDEGLLRRAIQSPTENDLIQLAEHAGQVGFQSAPGSSSGSQILRSDSSPCLAASFLQSLLELADEFLAESLGHVGQEDAAAHDVVLLQVAEQGDRIGVALGKHFRLFGKEGPSPLLLDVTDLLAVLGSQFIDTAFGVDRAIEFQQAQGLLEVGHGHEHVGRRSPLRRWPGRSRPRDASCQRRPVPCLG